jgi:hypothetical protein
MRGIMEGSTMMESGTYMTAMMISSALNQSKIQPYKLSVLISLRDQHLKEEWAIFSAQKAILMEHTKIVLLTST